MRIGACAGTRLLGRCRAAQRQPVLVSGESYDHAVDGAVVIGVVAVLTSGVFGPMVLYYSQKRRDGLTDHRAALDAAIDPLAKARAQVSWLQASGFRRDPDRAERDRRFEDLLHQAQLLEAHLVKLQIRFGEPLAGAYGGAAGAVNEQAGILWRRRSGVIPTVAQFDQEMHEAESVYVGEYTRFIELGRAWHGDRRLPRRVRAERASGTGPTDEQEERGEAIR